MAKTQKVTEQQREELARFVEKMNTLVPSEQQEVIFERAKTNTGHYVINAGPGSGKTWTSIKLSTFFTDSSSIYFSFNKKVQVDTTHKLNALGSKMTASTVHSFGLMCMNNFFDHKAKCQMKNSKYDDLIQDYMERHWNSFYSSIRSDLSDKELEKSGEWIYETKTWSRTLIKYHQLSLCGLDPLSLRSLIEQFDLIDINPKARIWPFVVANVALATANLVNLLNPEMIVLDGGVVRNAKELFIDPLEECVKAYSLPAAWEGTLIKAGELVDKAIVFGAVATVIDTAFGTLNLAKSSV